MMFVARLSGSFRNSEGMERGWTMRFWNNWSGTQATVSLGPKPSTLAAVGVWF
jgi:hypothetical protein